MVTENSHFATFPVSSKAVQVTLVSPREKVLFIGQVQVKSILPPELSSRNTGSGSEMTLLTTLAVMSCAHIKVGGSLSDIITS